MQHVNVLAAKSRAVNTLALDKSVQYLLTELQSLQPNAMAAGLNLDIDVFQSSPGTFSIALGHFPFVNSYDNLTSVVVRLRPSADDLASVESLLVNAHIDSAIGSPGANDNIAGVSLALDIVRCLVEHHHEYGIVRPIVFLFNGAEEVILSGAHSFVTQHPWAQSIVAHINLESLGSGDYYHLFRLGPNNPWLAHAYARAVSVPSSSVVGTDIFETKVNSLVLITTFSFDLLSLVNLLYLSFFLLPFFCILVSSFLQKLISVSLKKLLIFQATILCFWIMVTSTTPFMTVLRKLARKVSFMVVHAYWN